MQPFHFRTRLSCDDPSVILCLQVDPNLRLSSEGACEPLAISGVTGARPFTIAETCLRLTPSASAALVTVTPSGFIYLSLRVFCVVGS